MPEVSELPANREWVSSVATPSTAIPLRWVLVAARHLHDAPRPSEQQHGDGHLNDDEPVLQRQAPEIDRLQPFVAQILQQVYPCGLERRRQAERHARDQRQADRESEHAIVDCQIHVDRKIDLLQRPHGPPGQEAAGDAARDRPPADSPSAAYSTS